jgi:catechol 2,3-dioxygenase-like lactoylglutathione lyase family enzyme
MGVKQEQIARVHVRSQPLIAVRDVRASSRWYQTLLAADSMPEHEHRNWYDRIFCDGQLALQLHAWDEDNHPNLINADAAPVGHGVLLWFQVGDFDAAVRRVRSLNAQILQGPHVNPNSGQEEIWIRDPDGYVVVVAGPGGDTGA